MYKSEDRELLLNKIIDFMKSSSDFEGLIQIGSGAIGFADIYSDIDLMAGCYDLKCVKNADMQLSGFFRESGSCHIEKRAWSDSVLGISVYFENGLSADISFMPTAEIPIRSPLHKIIFSKTENFSESVNRGVEKFEQQKRPYAINSSANYRFVSELRYAEIAALRGEFIFADISLNNARQILLAAETLAEGKKLHQFKAYNTLSEKFLEKLKNTYPQKPNAEGLSTAKNNLLSLYLETVENSRIFNFDESLLKLLNCFE